MKSLVLIFNLIVSIQCYAAGREGGGGFAHDPAQISLRMAASDIIKFMPRLKHPKLNEQNKSDLVSALKTLVSEPEGTPRYRYGKRLFMDFETSPAPKLIATESFFTKYSSISEPEGVIRAPLYYQIRKDLIHELAHIIGIGILDDEEASDFANTVTLDYEEETDRIYAWNIGRVIEVFSLYKPSSYKVYFRMVGEHRPFILIKPTDMSGLYYTGHAIQESGCKKIKNIRMSALIEFNFDGSFSGELSGLFANENRRLSCDNMESYIETRKINGKHKL